MSFDFTNRRAFSDGDQQMPLEMISKTVYSSKQREVLRSKAQQLEYINIIKEMGKNDEGSKASTDRVHEGQDDELQMRMGIEGTGNAALESSRQIVWTATQKCLDARVSAEMKFSSPPMWAR